jgi:hypothetical protein
MINSYMDEHSESGRVTQADLQKKMHAKSTTLLNMGSSIFSPSAASIQIQESPVHIAAIQDATMQYLSECMAREKALATPPPIVHNNMVVRPSSFPVIPQAPQPVMQPPVVHEPPPAITITPPTARNEPPPAKSSSKQAAKKSSKPVAPARKLSQKDKDVFKALNASQTHIATPEGDSESDDD